MYHLFVCLQNQGQTITPWPSSHFEKIYYYRRQHLKHELGEKCIEKESSTKILHIFGIGSMASPFVHGQSEIRVTRLVLLVDIWPFNAKLSKVNCSSIFVLLLCYVFKTLILK